MYLNYRNLNIDLSGLLSVNSYAVLERTSDDTVLGEAFLIYNGALVNGGATLVLKDENGQIMDQVAGGENWQNIEDEKKRSAEEIEPFLLPPHIVEEEEIKLTTRKSSTQR